MRHSDAMLRSLFLLLLCACAAASSAPVYTACRCQTEPSEDVEQTVGKHHVSEITWICEFCCKVMELQSL